jgi:hypothetical protein
MRKDHVFFSVGMALRDGGDGILNQDHVRDHRGSPGCGSGGASSRFRAPRGIVIEPQLQTDRYTETLGALQSQFCTNLMSVHIESV